MHQAYVGEEWQQTKRAVLTATSHGLRELIPFVEIAAAMRLPLLVEHHLFKKFVWRHICVSIGLWTSEDEEEHYAFLEELTALPRLTTA